MKQSKLINIMLMSFLCFSTQQYIHAGYNNYTIFRRIKNWAIESKFDSESNKIICRAHIPSYYNWFGEGIFINSKGDLVVPKELAGESNINQNDIRQVKLAISQCRKGFYTILDDPKTNSY